MLHHAVWMMRQLLTRKNMHLWLPLLWYAMYSMRSSMRTSLCLRVSVCEWVCVSERYFWKQQGITSNSALPPLHLPSSIRKENKEARCVVLKSNQQHLFTFLESQQKKMLCRNVTQKYLAIHAKLWLSSLWILNYSWHQPKLKWPIMPSSSTHVAWKMGKPWNIFV